MKKEKEFLINEVPKHKKKSKAKDLPRADHKHVYETGLLYTYHRFKNFLNNGEETREYINPTKICSICGRIGVLDTNPIYYIEERKSKPFIYINKELSKDAFKLPKWKAEDLLDKFATRMDEA